MDEPTAALAIKEVGKVLDLINGLKDRGISVGDNQPPDGRYLLRLRSRHGLVPRPQFRRSRIEGKPAEARSSAGSWEPWRAWKSPRMTVSDEMNDSKGNPTAEKPPRGAKLLPFLDHYGILIVIALMCVALWALQPDVFFTWRNITNIFKQTAANGMLSIGDVRRHTDGGN